MFFGQKCKRKGLLKVRIDLDFTPEHVPITLHFIYEVLLLSLYQSNNIHIMSLTLRLQNM